MKQQQSLPPKKRQHWFISTISLHQRQAALQHVPAMDPEVNVTMPRPSTESVLKKVADGDLPAHACWLPLTKTSVTNAISTIQRQLLLRPGCPWWLDRGCAAALRGVVGETHLVQGSYSGTGGREAFIIVRFWFAIVFIVIQQWCCKGAGSCWNQTEWDECGNENYERILKASSWPCATHLVNWRDWKSSLRRRTRSLPAWTMRMASCVASLKATTTSSTDNVEGDNDPIMMYQWQTAACA